MLGTRRLWIVITIVLLALIALVGFYVWLAGGTSSEQTGTSTPAPSAGIVPVRSIYTYADEQNIQRPVGIGADANGGFFVTLLDATKIIEFDARGKYVQHWGERGTDPGQLLAPTGVAVDRLADHVYVIDRARLKLIAYDTVGKFLWEVPVLNPVSVEVDSEGLVIVTTFGPIATFTSEGELQGQAGSRGPDPGQFDYARQTASDGNGVVYVADANNARVQAVRLEGEATATVLWSAGTKPKDAEDVSGRFGLPTGVATTADGRPIVLDSFRHTISLLDPRNGEDLADFGGERRGVADGLLEMPTNIVRLRGDLFAVTDTGNDRVQILRIVAPGQRQPWNLFPGLRWLALLLLLPLGFVFGRKRTYVTDAALERAVSDGNARLVLAATKRPFVLPDTLERYGSVEEGGRVIGELAYSLPVAAGEIETADDRLIDACRLTARERALLRRHYVICVDDAQAERVRMARLKPRMYSDIVEQYALKE